MSGLEPVATTQHITGSVAVAQDNIKVAVRIRPATVSEKVVNFRQMVKKVDDNLLVFDPASSADGKSIMPDELKRRRIGIKRHKNQKYSYDHIFDEDSSSSSIFERTTRPLINFVVQGYAATVFAYGATGSGKTHTMLGSAASGPGVMVLAIEALFEAMKRAEEEHSFSLCLSYLEVYNETIRDLLPLPGTMQSVPPGGLELRHEARKGVNVCGLTEHEPEHASEVLEMIERGNMRRCVSETAANAESSRSHAVLQIKLRRSSKVAGTTDELTLGQLTLIDLAGSERAAISLNRGARLHEGANINRSLLALGNCINALSSGKRGCHVPYRDSKLTRLLKDSLGGNCRTVMIATVSPAPGSCEDTHNTLKYAHRAKTIRVDATTRTQTVEYHVSKYQDIIESLQQEVLLWKRRAGHRGSSDGANLIDLPPPRVLSEVLAPPLAALQPAVPALPAPPLSNEGAELFALVDALYTRRASAQQQLWELLQVVAKGEQLVTLADGRKKSQARASPLSRSVPATPWLRSSGHDLWPAQARVKAHLEATLEKSEAEEAELRTSLDALFSAERRAVLMQEMRCRQLQLDNAYEICASAATSAPCHSCRALLLSSPSALEPFCSRALLLSSPFALEYSALKPSTAALCERRARDS